MGAFLGMNSDMAIYNIYVWRFTVPLNPYSDLDFYEEELEPYVVPGLIDKAEYSDSQNIENE